MRLKGVPNIERANVQLDDKTGEYYLSTIGSNLARISDMEGIDRSRTYTNNIIEIYEYLVSKHQGKQSLTNCRLLLMEHVLKLTSSPLMVADVMTSEGEVRAVGRHGVSGTKHNPRSCCVQGTVNHLLGWNYR